MKLGFEIHKTNVGIRICILKYHVHQFSDKTLTFLAEIWPKIDSGVKISKIQVWIRNQHPSDTMCTNFLTKWTTLHFWAQICPKMDFGVGISKI